MVCGRKEGWPSVGAEPECGRHSDRATGAPGTCSPRGHGLHEHPPGNGDQSWEESCRPEEPGLGVHIYTHTLKFSFIFNLWGSECKGKIPNITDAVFDARFLLSKAHDRMMLPTSQGWGENTANLLRV